MGEYNQARGRSLTKYKAQWQLQYAVVATVEHVHTYGNCSSQGTQCSQRVRGRVREGNISNFGIFWKISI